MDDHNPRYVSRLTRNTLALVLAGGRGSRLYELTNWRAKPALYFGGKYRIIDFPLSNCVNSGIRQIGVLTQYKAYSLIRHLMRGWSHFKKEFGEFVEILPASQRFSDDWYQGTADAVYQNLDIIRAQQPDHVLILSGDHIYKMDYGPMLVEHVESGADMTVCCLEVPVAEAANTFGVMQVDTSGRVVGFEEKPAEPREIPGKPGMCLASMGNYVFNTEFLYEQLIHDAAVADSTRDFGHDVIPAMIATCHVHAYPFRDPQTGEKAYWRDVGTLDSFWLANMELVSTTPRLNLYEREWPLWTYQEQLPPAKFVWDKDDRRGEALDSMVAGGVIVSGSHVSGSVIFSNARLHSYSRVHASVILPETEVGRRVQMQNTIVDRGCIIPEGMRIGFDSEEDRENGFRVSTGGVVLITRGMLGLAEGSA
ncbi:glucose-1-phosphate adenylyltransferase [Chromatocurvus halotolerans]|uniref:Glucose-1-phosphate adenylyltransferase n=1 Tax=Chromatocurvus halotolerans TaxID=1132028 RepID=A0A4R2L887_9GAMM|nr:glucose-1-phosphate adenylyltransferase [Chromatocurvus halotolerans]TCO75455.1 glucose-1-phosphate adenylyltransferase [Chromatocurvus halotolerans]